MTGQDMTRPKWESAHACYESVSQHQKQTRTSED